LPEQVRESIEVDGACGRDHRARSYVASAVVTLEKRPVESLELLKSPGDREA
jgi:hypothetical protein